VGLSSLWLLLKQFKAAVRFPLGLPFGTLTNPGSLNPIIVGNIPSVWCLYCSWGKRAVDSYSVRSGPWSPGHFSRAATQPVNSQPSVMYGVRLPQTLNFALLVERGEVSVVPVLSLSSSFWTHSRRERLSQTIIYCCPQSWTKSSACCWYWGTLLITSCKPVVKPLIITLQGWQSSQFSNDLRVCSSSPYFSNSQMSMGGLIVSKTLRSQGILHLPVSPDPHNRSFCYRKQLAQSSVVCLSWLFLIAFLSFMCLEADSRHM